MVRECIMIPSSNNRIQILEWIENNTNARWWDSKKLPTDFIPDYEGEIILFLRPKEEPNLYELSWYYYNNTINSSDLTSFEKAKRTLGRKIEYRPPDSPWKYL